MLSIDWIHAIEHSHLTVESGEAIGRGRSLLDNGPYIERPVEVDQAGRIVLPAGLSAADLHCHTDRSDGVVPLEHVLDVAESRGIRVLAVTDHDMIRGALEASQLSIHRETDLVVGQEVTTRWQHHIIGLYLSEPVPLFRTVPDTVRAIRQQGGLAVVAHPGLGLPTSASLRAITGWMKETTFDGIELDSSFLSSPARRNLLDFYKKHGERLGAGIGGTDAHYGDVGRVITIFEGETPDDLRTAIESRRTVVARTNLEYPGADWRMRLKNQQRALLWLPLYRLKVMLGGNYSKARR